MAARLGVNIDHVATLRQARGEHYPSMARAAKTVLDAGAEQITIHLREDRRHIQDVDLKTVRQVTHEKQKLFNFEMGCVEEIEDLAIDIRPDWICLVPEKREELTTEGGLNLLDEKVFERVKTTCEKLKSKIDGVKISLFLEANAGILEQACRLPIEAVEVHTGDYARKFLEGDDYENDLKEFENAYYFLKQHNVHTHAGHGLTSESLKPLVEQNLFEEYNIGHWIVCESVFKGLSQVVSEIKKQMGE